MNDEFNKSFGDSLTPLYDYISQSPSLPPIASLLMLMHDAGELYSKENDPSRSKRTLLKRFIDEQAVDLDTFPKNRDEVLDIWNELTQGLGTHWLDASHWFQVIDAYASLTRQLSVLGAKSPTIGTCIAGTIASWFAISLFRWTRDKRNTIDSLTLRNQLWFLPNKNDSTPYLDIFSELKRKLQLSSSSYYSLTNTLLPNEAKEFRDELAKMIGAWCSGEIVPQLKTLHERIELPLISIGQLEIAKEFRSEAISVSFGRALVDWGAGIGAWKPIDTVHDAMAGMLEALAREESSITFIPSPRFMNKTEEYFEGFQLDFWSRIANPEEQKNAFELTKLTSEIIQEISISVPGVDSNPFKAAELESLALPLRYRFGQGYTELEEHAMQIAIHSADKKLIKRLHARRSFEQLAFTPYSSSKAWYIHIERTSKRDYQPFPGIDPSKAIEWARSYRKKQIDQWKVWGSFRRTRLMIVCELGNIELVDKLLSDGSDPKLVSDFSGNDRGDGKTALLLALQAAGSPRTVARNKNEEFKTIITQLLKYIGQDINTINQATFIRNLSPLSIAIENGDVDMVSSLLDAGAYLDRSIGSDELSRIYFAISELFRNMIYLKRGADGFISWDNNKGADVNPQRIVSLPPGVRVTPRMVSSTELFASLPADVKKYEKLAMESLFSDAPKRVDGLRDVIPTLLERGANPDRLQSNGRYPLDMADELDQEIGDSSIRILLEQYGAVKRAI